MEMTLEEKKLKIKEQNAARARAKNTRRKKAARKAGWKSWSTMLTDLEHGRAKIERVTNSTAAENVV